MSNTFSAAGNLGDTPTLKQVTVDGESKSKLELSIYVDRPVPVDGGGFEDKGGFWLRAEIWDKAAEQAAPLLAKGARGRVEGSLVQETWKKKGSDETDSALKLKLYWIALDPARIQEVQFKKSTRARGASAPDESSSATAEHAADLLNQFGST
jgi:single-strand DNA-binding protein